MMKRLLDEQGVRLLCLAIGALVAVQGVWAFVAPRSFFDTLAEFHPYNAHFIRDIGSIQFGVGIAAVVGASRRATAVVAGLAGLVAFQVPHIVSHVIDWSNGGRPGFDVPALSAMALLTAVALAAAVRQSGARD